MYRALIVEDDTDLAAITQIHLVRNGYETDTAGSCADALDCLEQKVYDLILLDVILPDARGDQLCSTIRASCATPVIFMSCLDSSDTIITALKNGGDDYMVKPINYGELLARADAIIRRSREPRQLENVRHFRQFSIDLRRHRVMRNGQEVPLSSIEYAMLVYMASRPDTLLLYRELYEQVWASDSLGDIRTVMVHISNLRKKIDPDHSGLIATVRGAGYIFTDI